jgi:hypothetical protein
MCCGKYQVCATQLTASGLVITDSRATWLTAWYSHWWPETSADLVRGLFPAAESNWFVHTGWACVVWHKDKIIPYTTQWKHATVQLHMEVRCPHSDCFTPQENTLWLPLHKVLGGFQKWSECCGEEKFLPMTIIKPRFLSCPVCSLITMPTELSSSLGYLWRR